MGAILDAAEAYDDQREATLRVAAELSAAARDRDVVKRILIHLDRRSPTGGFDRFGLRLVPIYYHFQAALVLHGDKLLAPADVIGVAREMLASGEYTLAQLANSLQDLLRRGRLRRDVATQLALEAQEIVEARRKAKEWADL